MATPPTFSAGAVLTAGQMNQLGLFLVASQAVGASAVTSVDIDECFSGEYDNYLISFNGISASGNMSLLFALLSAGTPTSSGWVATEYYTSVGGTSLTGQLSNGAGAAAFCSAATAASGLASVMEIQSPFKAQQTRFQYSMADSAFYRFGFALHTAATSYDGFRVTCTGGYTISNGVISVYGRRK
jgi:hypothetical protein